MSEKNPTITIKATHERWRKHRRPVDITGEEAAYVGLVQELMEKQPLDSDAYGGVMRQFARRGYPWLGKSQLLQVYYDLCEGGFLTFDPAVRTHIQMKPTRTQAGVTTVTVLTKPYPCPGKCIFCPTDVRMPKSYLHDEPGAMRAERHQFDPYEQTAMRLRALTEIGHPTAKIELLILGGTWSSYRRDYQEWFVKRCFDAMNGVDSETLAEAQERNERAKHRNVGLVVETRQDHIDLDELRWFRYLGVTKVQIGVQSLDDDILAMNKRGHGVDATQRAFGLLRLAGYKIHAHWMPNLLGATPESDVADFAQLWADEAVRPDELKIYPCMLVENAELYTYWQRGEYQPYTDEQVVDILVACKRMIPRWVRINRVIRDIPTTNVVAGIQKANLRQVAQQRLKSAGTPCQCIRCREIRREQVTFEELTLRVDSYDTDLTQEYFLSYEREDGRIAGFLRLSLPQTEDSELVLPALRNHAMIREVHVYGPAIPIGKTSEGEAQHIGLGTRLINEAKRMAREAGYGHLAVISAIGTRRYYAKQGFSLHGLYMTTPLL